MILELEHELYKTSLEHPVMPESKEALKELLSGEAVSKVHRCQRKEVQ
jgi:hypothetical protein